MGRVTILFDCQELSKKNCIFTRFKRQTRILITAEKKTGLILSRSLQEGYAYLNIGRELSSALQSENIELPSFSIKALDYLREILNSGIKTDAQGRQYLAIDNFSILFEPALKINLRAIIEAYAKQYLLLLRITNSLQGANTYYPFPEDKTYKLDFSGLSPITLE